ncbi:prepilin-type N-terminal cleavage/methylation domain-containing protein [Candidatus Dependentiae bacterium]|nr:prepilin-type N-terminal cleavage/methylation domain-containing protein [Candidatus Dependentiae bacterium]
MKSGFSLIELVIVIALIGVITGLMLPRLRKRETSVGQDFIVRLNAFVQEGAQAALQTSHAQTITFNFASNTIERSPEQGRMTMPSELEFTDIVINGESQLATGKVTKTFFYILPDGTAQEVRILFVDHEQEKLLPNSGNYELVLNPFTVQFKLL